MRLEIVMVCRCPLTKKIVRIEIGEINNLHEKAGNFMKIRVQWKD